MSAWTTMGLLRSILNGSQSRKGYKYPIASEYYFCLSLTITCAMAAECNKYPSDFELN